MGSAIFEPMMMQYNCCKASFLCHSLLHSLLHVQKVLIEGTTVFPSNKIAKYMLIEEACQGI